MNHSSIGTRLLALSLFAGSTGASAQQVSPAADNPQVSGTPAAAAQLPHLVKFGGAVRDASGKPMSTMTGITFALYQDQQGGPSLWMENQNVQPDAAGRYTVWLGATKNEGVPVELFASGQARWLGVQVEGQPEQTRVLLAAVPYALKAGDADTLGGKPASAYLLAGSSTLVLAEGPSAAAQPAQSAAAVTARTAAAVVPSFSSTGSTNYIAKFTDTSGDAGNSVMYQNGTSIGINTTTTLDILDVAGSITAEVDGGPTSGPALDLRNAPPTGFGIGSVNFYTYPGQTVPSAQWQAKDIGGFTASQTLYTAGNLNQRNQPLIPRLTVMGGTGNVGIGTTTPVAPLEVNGNAQVDGNLTLTGSILSPTNGIPVIQAPTNGSNNFSAGLGALPPATTGTGDTAVGDGALKVNTTGGDNTAVGTSALAANTTGTYNTASGYQALYSNTIGIANTATGSGALYSNTTGSYNTTSGNQAMYYNTTGMENTASGYAALGANTTGVANTASGAYALSSNTTGGGNTASGDSALNDNTTGSSNTATGYSALSYNTTGSFNTASGNFALHANASGGHNTASGYQALYYNTTGSNNIAIGYNAGLNVTTSNNIDIGNVGDSSDSATIRIGCATTCYSGTLPQTATYIAGITGTNIGSSTPVFVNAYGQLGTIQSSRRYKEDIQDMGDASSGLMRLRPVTFRYKKPFNDGSQPIQYGLIAEEVAEVYPDLVARSADGQIETVKYQLLDPMLLNELQKQSSTIAAQKEQIRSLEERVERMEAALQQICASLPSRQR